MSLTVTTETTTEVKLKPALKTALRKKLGEYAIQKAIENRAKAVQERLKAEIEKAFVDAGEFGALCDGVRIDDFPLKYTSGTKKAVDWKFIHSQGWMTAAQKQEATKETPKKSYLAVRCPGESEANDDRD